jgi:hypothetical protein
MKMNKEEMNRMTKKRCRYQVLNPITMTYLPCMEDVQYMIVGYDEIPDPKTNYTTSSGIMKAAEYFCCGSHLDRTKRFAELRHSETKVWVRDGTFGEWTTLSVFKQE